MVKRGSPRETNHDAKMHHVRGCYHIVTSTGNLCRNWTGSCPPPKVKKSNGQYNSNLPANTKCCIDATPSTEQQNLYVTGTIGSPLPIGGVVPQPVSG